MVKINSNNYYKLTEKEKSNFRPFNYANASTLQSYADSCIIEKITSGDIRLLTKNSNYTWIHFFSPWCASESCTNLKGYVDFAAQHPLLRFVLISNSYDYADIKNLLHSSGYMHMVYVRDNISYPENLSKANHLFAAQLTGGNGKNYSSDYLLRADSVILKKDWDET